MFDDFYKELYDKVNGHILQNDVDLFEEVSETRKQIVELNNRMKQSENDSKKSLGLNIFIAIMTAIGVAISLLALLNSIGLLNLR